MRGSAETKSIFDANGKSLQISPAVVNSNVIDWVSLDSASPEHNGVGDFKEVCTATFIETDGTAESPAYFLTSGHCIAGIKPNDFLVNVTKGPDIGTVVRLNRFADQTKTLNMTVTEIAYATVTWTDVALLRVGGTFSGFLANGEPVPPGQPVTYGKLREYGYHPKRIATKAPYAGEPVEALQIPIGKNDARIDPSQVHLRMSRCLIEATDLGLAEDDSFGATRYKWPVVRHHCSVLGGSSGAGLYDRVTGEMVGTHFTSAYLPDILRAHVLLDNQLIVGSLPEGCHLANEGGDCMLAVARCIANAPCEISPKKQFVNVNANYAGRVQDIPGCFDDTHTFSLTLASCTLRR